MEELGSVYESLLDFAPYFSEQNGRLTFEFGYGTERKSTGSYYTPHELVSELIKSALVPVLEERLKSAKTKKEKENAILSLKVCDPAAGSGHFLLAAAIRLGRELAKIRTGDDEPAPEQMRLAVRDCITHCIYGVDKNPLAVDLCKVALWIEGHSEGKPLTFLDHRIRCGDSLIGVMDLQVLKEGIPDAAFKPVVGDDKVVARSVKQENRKERKGQRPLPFRSKTELQAITQDRSLLMKLADDTPEQIRRKAEAYRKSQSKGTKWWQDNTACHLWTAAFFVKLTQANLQNSRILTTDTVNRYLDTHSIDARFIGTAWALAQSHRFFHWPLEFPEVFTDDGEGGFDCLLGNPPWEQIELAEKEFFMTRDRQIANAPNAASRKRLIEGLSETNYSLWQEFVEAKRSVDSETKFIRASDRYRLSAVGRINSYQIFAGLARDLISRTGRAGIVIPSGIAADDSNKMFFADLTEKRALVSLHDFENRKGIFPAVHRSYKFCLLTVGGKNAAPKGADFAFFLANVSQMKEEDRHLSLSAEDIALLNPNTRTCAIFRRKRDAEITKAIYRRVPVLIDDNKGDGGNPWGISFKQGLFNMASDSHLFRTREELEKDEWKLEGNVFVRGGERYLPLYEAKMIHQHNHRHGSIRYTGHVVGGRHYMEYPSNIDLSNPQFCVMPRFWVSYDEANERSYGWLSNNRWFLCYRRITRSVDFWTSTLGIIPEARTGDTSPVLFIRHRIGPTSVLLLCANFNSFVVNYAARQKVSGVHLDFYHLKQLPVLPLEFYRSDQFRFLMPLVTQNTLFLSYVSYDLTPFAKDCGYDGKPFQWDDQKRLTARCELDAVYFHLYGINRDDVEYIMETFPIVKQKYDEYRTKRVILECYDAMAEAMKTGLPYQTILDPPAADPRVAHLHKE